MTCVAGEGKTMIGVTAESTPLRDASEVADFARRCFQPATSDRVGVELEFLVFDRAEPARHVALAQVEGALQIGRAHV